MPFQLSYLSELEGKLGLEAVSLVTWISRLNWFRRMEHKDSDLIIESRIAVD